MNKIGFKLTLLVSIAILFSVSLVAYGAYGDIRNAIEQKVGETGLLNLVALKAATIEGIVHSGIEVSKSLAQDPTMRAWFKGNEEDERLGRSAIQKLRFIVEDLGYRISFAANLNTLHFWTHEKLTDTLSEKDPDDSWFFDFLDKNRSVEINVESNNELNEIFVWVNVLMGISDAPVGVAGLGFPFEKSAEDFTSHEFGEFGKVWMIDTEGRIQIDEHAENLNRDIRDFIPPAVAEEILRTSEKSHIHEYEDKEHGIVAFAAHRITDTDSLILIRIHKTRWIWSLLSPYFRNVISGASFVLVIVVSLFTLISFFISRIFTRLSRAILVLGEGNFDNHLGETDRARKDELGDIARGIDTARTKLAQAYSTLTSLNETFERFVPKQFLNRIAKKGIGQIRLGDGESDMITILFSDIRSFTTLSEKMSPQELLDFLNGYFKQMNQPIHKHSGFIDKFIGDAIMALFDRPKGGPEDEAKNAVMAAIGMQEALKDYNAERAKPGYEAIRIGIGIHSGPVVIGTVGSEDRMDSTVLGDSVNMASRLEGLTKRYHSQIIISSHTYRLLCTESASDNPGFLCRELDFVSVKGKIIPEVIYEVFDSDPEAVRERKRRILSDYHQGLESYYSGNWAQAIRLFKKCLEIYPEDHVSKLHLEQCLEFQKNPPPPGWKGVSCLKQK